jgi:hypothetical protein
MTRYYTDCNGLKFAVCKKCGGSGMFDYGDFHIPKTKRCNACEMGRVYKGTKYKGEQP